MFLMAVAQMSSFIIVLNIISQVFVDTLKHCFHCLLIIAENPVISLWVYFENKMSHLTDYFKDLCRGHGGRVVTLLPPTSGAGVRSRHARKW